MPAFSEEFPWPSSYGHFNFFEDRMRGHSCVVAFKQHGDGLYEITTRRGKVIRVFICECYAFGVAEYLETINKLGELGAVVINSMWCGYSLEAKRYCRDKRVGLFKIGDFMAALNNDDFWNYLNGYEVDDFKRSGWI